MPGLREGRACRSLRRRSDGPRCGIRGRTGEKIGAFYVCGAPCRPASAGRGRAKRRFGIGCDDRKMLRATARNPEKRRSTQGESVADGPSGGLSRRKYGSGRRRERKSVFQRGGQDIFPDAVVRGAGSRRSVARGRLRVFAARCRLRISAGERLADRRSETGRRLRPGG